MQESKVKVKIMAHVGQHKPGDVVEVDAQQAKYMCEVRKRNDGTSLVEHVVAMRLEDYEAMVKKIAEDTKRDVKKGSLTQADLNSLGIKNVVETPKDPAFEARLAKLQQGKAEQAEAAKKDKKKSKGGKAAQAANPTFEEKHESEEEESA